MKCTHPIGEYNMQCIVCMAKNIAECSKTFKKDSWRKAYIEMVTTNQTKHDIEQLEQEVMKWHGKRY